MNWALPIAASAHAAEIDTIMLLVHSLMLALAVGWGGVFIYTLIRFRRSRQPKADYHGAKSRYSTYTEAGIVLAELILLVGFSIPAWATRTRDLPPEHEAVVVRVVGEQFASNAHYPGPDGRFGAQNPRLLGADNPLGLDPRDPAGKDDITTLNEIVVPVERPVIVHLSAKDVIHSFGVPAMRIKQDATPGLMTAVWFTPTVTGEFNVACSQLCGFGHYRMSDPSGGARRRVHSLDGIPEAVAIDRYTSAMPKLTFTLLALGLTLLAGRHALTQQPTMFDIIIRGGTVYDGTGAAGRRADVGIRGDRVAAVGDLASSQATKVVDATGLAVAPGFINMLSWATESLLVDGRSQGDIRQGVTLEIFGEGSSMGPMNEVMKKRAYEEMGDIKYGITWNSLAEYLRELERRGVSTNVASYIGATTIREYVIGLEDRKPTPQQMDAMRSLVRREMEAGALGIGSSLIYAPAFYASTEELIELCKVAAEYRGKYISHMRSEGNRLLEGVDELIRISREAKIPAEIYHLKAAGQANWPKMDQVIAKIEAARMEGLKITADMYTYTAGATGLDAAMPPWVLDGGFEEAYKRLADPAVRPRIADAIRTGGTDWENLYVAAGSPERVILVGFKNEKLKHFTGKTLAEVAKSRGEDPVDAIMNLVLEDRSRVGTVYFLMSEDNLRKQIALPWLSFGSDAGSMSPELPFTKSSTHPRAYGNFARLLGRYVRDEKVITLADAIRKLTGLPATNLELDRRGFLREGMFADVAVFDPQTITDHATFETPHRFATGMRHVFVNGGHVLENGQHTGATPGRVVNGPGKK